MPAPGTPPQPNQRGLPPGTALVRALPPAPAAPAAPVPSPNNLGRYEPEYELGEYISNPLPPQFDQGDGTYGPNQPPWASGGPPARGPAPVRFPFEQRG